MTYRQHPITLVARSAQGGFLDDLLGVGKSTFGIIASGEQAKGAADVLKAQNAALVGAPSSGPFGLSPVTLLLLAGAGVGIFLLLRKKKTK